MDLGLVGWYTRKQWIVAVSSTEAEYVTMDDYGKDGLSLYFSWENLCSSPITMCMVSQGVMFMPSNLGIKR